MVNRASDTRPPVGPVPGPVVGFDLDMTLVDSRPGIRAVWDVIAAETGVPIDSELAVSRLGPPLRREVAEWFPPERNDEIVARYRALYPDFVDLVEAQPGAVDALAAVHAYRGRTVLVSAKQLAGVRLHVDHLGLGLDEVVGDLHGAQKGTALAEHGASIYVGDHVDDVAGARAAGAVAVAVATGPCSRADLLAAGADVVLNDLTEFPAWLDEHLLTIRLEALASALGRYERLLVAFSGGADSAFVLAAAVRALGADHVVAATAVSPSLAASELEPARAFAEALGVRHLTPATHEMDSEGYRANAGDRCYFCKAELLDTLGPLADELGIETVATGTNADDAVAGFRPGIRAAAERGAVTPLRDAGLTKHQIRTASERWSLPTAHKPAAACLSSRIPYGIGITPAKLARVDRAEQAVRAGLAAQGAASTDLRVRDLGERASIEIDADLLDRIDTDALSAAVTAVGFTAAELDPRGFRSGSMNERLADPDRYR